MTGSLRILPAGRFVPKFLAGTPVELIMKISGHKRTKDFYKYIRIYPEEAANKLKNCGLKEMG